MSIESKTLSSLQELILYEESTKIPYLLIATAFTLSFVAHSAFVVFTNNFQDSLQMDLSEQFLSVELVSATNSDSQLPEEKDNPIQEVKSSYKPLKKEEPDHNHSKQSDEAQKEDTSLSDHKKITPVKSEIKVASAKNSQLKQEIEYKKAKILKFIHHNLFRIEMSRKKR